MAVLLRPKGHGLQKPEVARIDPSHPLSQGLVAAMLFHEGGGAPIDLVRGVQSSVVPTWQADGITGGYSVTHPAYAPVMASPFTIIATVIIYSQPAGVFQDAAGCYSYVSESSNKGAFMNLRPAADTIPGFAFMGFNNDAFSLYTVAKDTAFPLATRLQYAAVYDGTTGFLYRNGVLIGSKAVTIIAPAANTPFANNTNALSTMRVLESRLYSRALRNGELARSAAEPYGFLLPQSPRHRLYVPASTVSASGTATLDLAASGTTAAPVTSTASLALSASGTTAAPVTSTGSLTLSASGTTAAAATSAANLNLTASGTAATLFSSTGTLNLTAAGTVQAAITSAAMLTLTASGVASVFTPTPTPAERIYRIPAENRVYLVPAENRTYRVPAENRVMVVT